ncbi:MAG: hypothetical protein EBX50_00415 [Chitinophagia bacterium]|nr:hypothetical protein [Chitinophagia bacterium]
MKMQVYILMLLSTCLLLGSCQKELSGEFTAYPNNPLNDTIWTATQKPTDGVNSIISDLMPPVEVASVDLSLPTNEIKIGGSDSCRLYFDKGIFVTIENGVITPVKPEGIATIEMYRIRNIGEMIRCMRPSQANGLLTEFAGGFFIRIIKDGKELSLASRQSYLVKWIEAGSDAKTDMRVYYSRESSPTPLYNVMDFNFEWKEDMMAGTNPIEIVEETLSNKKCKVYKMLLSNFRWVSAQRPASANANSVRLTSFLPPNFTNKNTTVLAYFKKQKTVIKLDADYSSRSFKTDLLPKGAEITLVSISKIGSNYYYGEKDISSLDYGTITKIEPEKITLAKIQELLNNK